MSQAGKADLKEFPEKTRRRRVGVGDLPPSSDREFWGDDAEHISVNRNEIPRLTPKCGEFKQQGPFVICGTCPNSHTIPGFTLNHEGELVKLDKK